MHYVSIYKRFGLNKFAAQISMINKDFFFQKFCYLSKSKIILAWTPPKCKILLFKSTKLALKNLHTLKNLYLRWLTL